MCDAPLPQWRRQQSSETSRHTSPWAAIMTMASESHDPPSGLWSTIGSQRSPGMAMLSTTLLHAHTPGSERVGTIRLRRNGYRRQSGQRVTDAYFLLGCCYEYGRGVKKDPVRAVRLFLAAARSGHADAHVEVGLHHHDRSPRKAVEWYRRAAKLGSAAGQYNLAYCLERGRGVRTNLRDAARWYRAAARQGHGKARTALEGLQKRKAGFTFRWARSLEPTTVDRNAEVVCPSAADAAPGQS